MLVGVSDKDELVALLSIVNKLAGPLPLTYADTSPVGLIQPHFECLI